MCVCVWMLYVDLLFAHLFFQWIQSRSITVNTAKSVTAANLRILPPSLANNDLLFEGVLCVVCCVLCMTYLLFKGPSLDTWWNSIGPFPSCPPLLGEISVQAGGDVILNDVLRCCLFVSLVSSLSSFC